MFTFDFCRMCQNYFDVRVLCFTNIWLLLSLLSCGCQIMSWGHKPLRPFPPLSLPCFWLRPPPWSSECATIRFSSLLQRTWMLLSWKLVCYRGCRTWQKLHTTLCWKMSKSAFQMHAYCPPPPPPFFSLSLSLFEIVGGYVASCMLKSCISLCIVWVWVYMCTHLLCMSNCVNLCVWGGGGGVHGCSCVHVFK